MRLSFVKLHGAGNDFVLVDEFGAEIVSDEKKPSFIRKISARRFGVGGDGVIFVQSSDKAHARFVFYNPDGSRAEMCGNGIRCFGKYVYESGIAKNNPLRVETDVGVIMLKLDEVGGEVKGARVDMGKPVLEREKIPAVGEAGTRFVDEEIILGDETVRVTAVGMGNPHAVLFVEDVELIDVLGLGSKIRNKIDVFPKGVNVHFIQSVGVNEFKIRSYERGVEDETLACGTGICACAMGVVLNNKADDKKKIIFHARGGILSVELIDGRLYLNGPAAEVFRGSLSYG